jgi:hypothetical protein
MRKELRDLLTGGGDERVFINKTTNRNKYNLNPLLFSGLLNRGSCTSGSLNPETYALVEATELEQFESAFDAVVEDHAEKIKQLYNLEGSPDFEVFFAPSGSDLVYLPLLFSRLLNPGKQAVNILTCPEELGSGSQVAAHGNYYASLNQFGEKVEKDAPLSDQIQPDVKMLPARDKAGKILNNHAKLHDLITANPDVPKIVNLVYGSKSGIEEKLHIIDEIDQSEILWTVDLCQFRNKKDLVNDLLSKGVSLLITGSKFYQAPPFCGALLVPKSLCLKLSKCDPAPAQYFRGIFTQHDIPSCLPNIRKQFKLSKNLGLHLRWKCALHEMIALDNLGEAKIFPTIKKWNEKVMQAITASRYLESMPDMELTNKSIISFRIKYDGRYLDNGKLKELFAQLVTDTYSGFSKYDKIFMGQPVKYDTGSFIRVALGSYDLRQYVLGNESDFADDLHLIEMIESGIETFLNK